MRHNLSEIEKEVLYYINILIDYDIEEDISVNIKSIINNATYLTSLKLNDIDSIIKNLIRVRILRIVPCVKNIVSNDFKEKLKQHIFIDYQEKIYIKKFSKDDRKIFYIDTDSEYLRFDMFWKYIAIKIKQTRHNLISYKLSDGSDLAEYVFNMFNYLVDIAIRYTICLERNPQEKNYSQEECRKIFVGKEDLNQKIEYRLDKKSQQALTERLIIFIENYQEQKKDVKANKDSNKKNKDEDFQNFKETLKNTIKCAKIDMERIFKKDIYKNDSGCKMVHNNHLKIIENIKTIVNTPAKARAFREELHNSNMHHISKHDNKYIFPILLDLIVNRYIFILLYTVYEKEFADKGTCVKLCNEIDEKYLQHTSSEYYDFIQLKELTDSYPQKYKSNKLKQNIEQNISIMIIKHYSETFNSDYNSIANILKQLFFNSNESKRREYDQYKEIKNETLNIDYDYFRFYSLYIM